MSALYLKRVEADHRLALGSIRNPDYKREPPVGQKIQWNFEQVQTALKNARATARTVLMLPLNCGF
jgi:hypothetical protein